jgi:hypothetical protein
MPHSEKPHDRTHVPRSGSPAPGRRQVDASAPHRAERRSPAVRAGAATGLLVLDLGVIPTARHSHTTGPGHAPMRRPHVSCQEVDPFAGGRSCCAWRYSHPRPILRWGYGHRRAMRGAPAAAARVAEADFDGLFYSRTTPQRGLKDPSVTDETIGSDEESDGCDGAQDCERVRVRNTTYSAARLYIIRPPLLILCVTMRVQLYA